MTDIIITEQDIALKSQFWRTIEGNPLIDVNTLTPENIEKILKKKIKSIYNPEYLDWFLNKSSIGDKLEYLLQLALSSAEKIFQSSDPKLTQAKIFLIKTVLEFYSKRFDKNNSTALSSLSLSSNNSKIKSTSYIEKLNKDELKTLLSTISNSVNTTAI